MHAISLPELCVVFREFSDDREIHVRRHGGGLVRSCTPYAGRRLVEERMATGMVGKHGFRYLQSLTSDGRIHSFLRRLDSGRNLPIAEDSKTVMRQQLGGGIVFTHIRQQAWSPGSRMQFV